MKRKPWAIILLAWLHVLAPFGNILFNSLRSGRTPAQTWYFWYYALPKPLVVTYILVPPLAGLLIYNCRRWSYWAYVLCLMFIFFSNIYGFWTQMNLVNFAAVMSVLLIDALAVAYFVAPSVRQVYFDPRLRWWETAPRYHFNENGEVLGVGAPATPTAEACVVRNISVGGAMVESSQDYPEGRGLELRWSYQGTPYQALGKVVYRKSQGTENCYGVKFDEVPEVKNAMKDLVKKLHAEGKMIRDRLPGPEDSFWTWFKKLIFRREGLFPENRKHAGKIKT